MNRVPADRLSQPVRDGGCGGRGSRPQTMGGANEAASSSTNPQGSQRLGERRKEILQAMWAMVHEFLEDETTCIAGEGANFVGRYIQQLDHIRGPQVMHSRPQDSNDILALNLSRTHGISALQMQCYDVSFQSMLPWPLQHAGIALRRQANVADFAHSLRRVAESHWLSADWSYMGKEDQATMPIEMDFKKHRHYWGISAAVDQSVVQQRGRNALSGSAGSSCASAQSIHLW